MPTESLLNIPHIYSGMHVRCSPACLLAVDGFVDVIEGLIDPGNYRVVALTYAEGQGYPFDVGS